MISGTAIDRVYDRDGEKTFLLAGSLIAMVPGFSRHSLEAMGEPSPHVICDYFPEFLNQLPGLTFPGVAYDRI